MNKNECIKIKFLGFEIICINPSKRGTIIVSRVLIFLLLVVFFLLTENN
jgi:hypothetical protein